MATLIPGPPLHLIEYFAENKGSIATITMSIDDGEPFQYNYWNWVEENKQLILLKDDYSVGHILYNGTLIINDDNSIQYNSEYYPKKCILNFYFGGASY
jgi:hypothetical protein